MIRHNKGAGTTGSSFNYYRQYTCFPGSRRREAKPGAMAMSLRLSDESQSGPRQEIEHGHATVGGQRLQHAVHTFWSQAPATPKQPPKKGLYAEVAFGHHIRPAESPDEQVVRGPEPKTSYRHDPGAHLVVGKAVQRL